MLHKFSKLPVLSGQNLTAHWQMALVTAIRMGNDMHDELYDAEGVEVAVDDAVSAVGQLARCIISLASMTSSVQALRANLRLLYCQFFRRSHPIIF